VQVTGWVMTRIVYTQGRANRVRLFSSFIELASELLEIGNMHDMVALMHAFGSVPIVRLKALHSAVKKKTLQKLQQMQELISPRCGFQKLRQFIASKSAPFIPYMGSLIFASRVLISIKACY
jgi:hypothetical protein